MLFDFCNTCCNFRLICYIFADMVKQMTVAQFAHKMKVNRSTVYRMINAKALPQGVTCEVLVGHIIITVPDNFQWIRK